MLTHAKHKVEIWPYWTCNLDLWS